VHLVGFIVRIYYSIFAHWLFVPCIISFVQHLPEDGNKKVPETCRKFSTCIINPHICTCWFYSDTKFCLILNRLCKMQLHMPLRAGQFPKTC